MDENKKLKIAGMILLGAIISLVVLSSMGYSLISTTGNNFKVDIVSEYHSIIDHEVIIEIYNLQDANRDFNLQFYMKDISFDYSELRDVYIYEWKPVPKEFPVYSTREVINGICYLQFEAGSYPCNYTERYQSGTELKNVLQWKETKMAMITQPDKISADYGSILIPKSSSKDKYDDFGAAFDGGGMKRFKITWKTPIGITEEGFGASGYYAFKDAISGYDYDPPFLSGWDYRREITITNPQANYPSYIEITYDSDMQNDFDDIRFTDDDGTTELDHFLREKTDGVEAKYDVVLPDADSTIYVYYGNAGASSASTIDAWDNDLIHYTIHDEGTGGTANDIVDVNGYNDGTINADWNSSSRRGDYALSFFRSASDDIDFGDTNDVSATGHITIEAWIRLHKCPAAGEYYTLARKWDMAGGDDGYAVHIDPNCKVYFDLATGGTTMGAVLSASGLSGSVGSWVLITATHDGSTATIYVNGAYSNSKSWAYSIPDASYNLWYGCMDGSQHCSNMEIDEFKIYDEALSSTIAGYHYAATEPTFSVGSEEAAGGERPPLWSSNTSSIVGTYSPSTSSTFNITWANGSAAAPVNTSYVYLESNYSGSAVNYTMSLISGDQWNGVYGYQNILPAGSHYWKSHAKNNETSPQWNVSDQWIFSIAKATANCTLSLDPSNSEDYETQTRATCICDNPEGSTTKLYRNGVDKTSENNTYILLGVGSYPYICNSTATQNYTAATDSDTLTISKADPTWNYYVNGNLNQNNSIQMLGNITFDTHLSILDSCSSCYGVYYKNSTESFKTIVGYWNYSWVNGTHVSAFNESLPADQYCINATWGGQC